MSTGLPGQPDWARLSIQSPLLAVIQLAVQDELRKKNKIRNQQVKEWFSRARRMARLATIPPSGPVPDHLALRKAIAEPGLGSGRV